ncbi:hypothetical protein J8273_6275 [Carpediemonas membranifera]|uniref:Uncharacterized protein n=1 Tax=Carpediemonas membranifera TaxID=201153 RepID=A0A8J6AQU7_9EUKA|nr:hypothetical protein J8273_6275 [Carpediemonas membranifera]|eukprot:KAG9391513.1 hypothetical protein J8273_6275 [Carpediemonas membranifera]
MSNRYPSDEYHRSTPADQPNVSFRPNSRSTRFTSSFSKWSGAAWDREAVRSNMSDVTNAYSTTAQVGNDTEMSGGSNRSTLTDDISENGLVLSHRNDDERMLDQEIDEISNPRPALSEVSPSSYCDHSDCEVVTIEVKMPPTPAQRPSEKTAGPSELRQMLASLAASGRLAELLDRATLPPGMSPEIAQDVLSDPDLIDVLEEELTRSDLGDDREPTPTRAHDIYTPVTPAGSTLRPYEHRQTRETQTPPQPTPTPAPHHPATVSRTPMTLDESDGIDHTPRIAQSRDSTGSGGWDLDGILSTLKALDRRQVHIESLLAEE